MNYGDLKADFLGLLKRRDITDTQADSFIQKAVNRVQRVLRVSPMEKTVTITYDGVTYINGQIPVPADYLRLISITVTDVNGNEKEVKQASLNEVLDMVQETGSICPRGFVRRGSTFQFGPIPAAGAVIRIDYYDEFSTLVAGSDNYLTNGAEDLIVFGALVYAASYFVDKRKQEWEDDFQRILAEIDSQSQTDTLINAAIRPAYDYPEDC